MEYNYIHIYSLSQFGGIAHSSQMDCAENSRCGIFTEREEHWNIKFQLKARKYMLKRQSL